ncbi:hypothetical protein HAX54_022489, partial [Datura stramonium]|nr:hypothetical protein [Datura stramonium]
MDPNEEENIPDLAEAEERRDAPSNARIKGCNAPPGQRNETADTPLNPHMEAPDAGSSRHEMHTVEEATVKYFYVTLLCAGNKSQVYNGSVETRKRDKNYVGQNPHRAMQRVGQAPLGVVRRDLSYA